MNMGMSSAIDAHVSFVVSLSLLRLALSDSWAVLALMLLLLNSMTEGTAQYLNRLSLPQNDSVRDVT
jgi:hypothetical protein